MARFVRVHCRLGSSLLKSLDKTKAAGVGMPAQPLGHARLAPPAAVVHHSILPTRMAPTGVPMPISMFLFQGPITPINLTEIIAVVMGISVVLIPVIGITARFALKPTVEAFSRLFEGRAANETISILERRMALMESQVESIESNVKRLVDASDFHQQLQSGPTPTAPEPVDPKQD
jgi:hypothetical protein